MNRKKLNFHTLLTVERFLKKMHSFLIADRESAEREQYEHQQRAVQAAQAAQAAREIQVKPPSIWNLYSTEVLDTLRIYLEINPNMTEQEQFAICGSIAADLESNYEAAARIRQEEEDEANRLIQLHIALMLLKRNALFQVHLL